MTVDRLSELRSIARAQALESFDYFANHVLGSKLPSEICDAVQKEIEQSSSNSYNYSDSCNFAVSAWLCVQGKTAKLPKAPTATFAWLFGDFLAQ